MGSQTFKEDIDRKLDAIWRFVAWSIAFLISLSICLPGIFISIQYSNDKCVKSTGNINIALDAWLLVACVFVIVYMVIILIFICVAAKNNIFKIFWFGIHAFQLAWYTIGIYLIANSTLDCTHNSLWQMSLAYCIVMGVAWIAESIIIIVKCSNARCCVGRCDSNICAKLFEDTEETYYYENIPNYQMTYQEDDFESQ